MRDFEWIPSLEIGSAGVETLQWNFVIFVDES